MEGIHGHTSRLTQSAMPGASLVDIFPFINHLPLWMSKWKRDALDWHLRETQRFQGFIEDVEDKMVKIFSSNDTPFNVYLYL